MENNINELKKEIAFLKDGYAYQKNMADLYAKKLKEIWDWLDDLIDEIKSGDINDLVLVYEEIKEIKNRIPESALNR